MRHAEDARIEAGTVRMQQNVQAATIHRAIVKDPAPLPE
jgi:hypothetical protein